MSLVYVPKILCQGYPMVLQAKRANLVSKASKPSAGASW